MQSVTTTVLAGIYLTLIPHCAMYAIVNNSVGLNMFEKATLNSEHWQLCGYINTNHEDTELEKLTSFDNATHYE
jgi:hypothetical protein